MPEESEVYVHGDNNLMFQEAVGFDSEAPIRSLWRDSGLAAVCQDGLEQNQNRCTRLTSHKLDFS